MTISLIYNQANLELLTGVIVPGTDTFKVLLLNATGAAVADETKRDSHLKRSDVDANEVTGTGYTAGGTTSTVTIAKDTANNKTTITIGAVSWATATITASGAVVYKSRGGANTADNLLCYIDFGGSFASTGGTYSLSSSTLTYQL